MGGSQARGTTCSQIGRLGTRRAHGVGLHFGRPDSDVRASYLEWQPDTRPVTRARRQPVSYFEFRQHLFKHPSHERIAISRPIPERGIDGGRAPNTASHKIHWSPRAKTDGALRRGSGSVEGGAQLNEAPLRYERTRHRHQIDSSPARCERSSRGERRGHGSSDFIVGPTDRIAGAASADERAGAPGAGGDAIRSAPARQFQCGALGNSTHSGHGH